MRSSLWLCFANEDLGRWMHTFAAGTMVTNRPILVRQTWPQPLQGNKYTIVCAAFAFAFMFFIFLLFTSLMWSDGFLQKQAQPHWQWDATSCDWRWGWTTGATGGMLLNNPCGSAPVVVAVELSWHHCEPGLDVWLPPFQAAGESLSQWISNGKDTARHKCLLFPWTSGKQTELWTMATNEVTLNKQTGCTIISYLKVNIVGIMHNSSIYLWNLTHLACVLPCSSE